MKPAPKKFDKTVSLAKNIAAAIAPPTVKLFEDKFRVPMEMGIKKLPKVETIKAAL